jgi:hypothetical protein
MTKIFTHMPHPHIERRRAEPPPRVADELPRGNALDRFNTFLALKITSAVGTMWCAYVFALIALVSLPSALDKGTPETITWLTQTFLQLVLLSIIIVGQKVQSAAADSRAQATYEDADAVLHTALEIQQHMEAQDREIDRILEEILRLQSANGARNGDEAT